MREVVLGVTGEWGAQVPPLFERDLRLRSRMAHSSYEYMFAKPAMRFLFDDYVQPLGRAWLSFRPSEVPGRIRQATCRGLLVSARPSSFES